MQRTFLTLGWSAWDLQVGERVVINKGKDNEYIKYLPLKQKAQKEAEKQSEDKETRSDGRGRRGGSGRR